jgi:hypothetical protein
MKWSWRHVVDMLAKSAYAEIEGVEPLHEKKKKEFLCGENTDSMLSENMGVIPAGAIDSPARR